MLVSRVKRVHTSLLSHLGVCVCVLVCVCLCVCVCVSVCIPVMVYKLHRTRALTPGAKIQHLAPVAQIYLMAVVASIETFVDPIELHHH